GMKRSDLLNIARLGLDKLTKVVEHAKRQASAREARRLAKQNAPITPQPRPLAATLTTAPDARRIEFDREIKSFNKEVDALRVILQSRPLELLALLTWEIYGTSLWKERTRTLRLELAECAKVRKRRDW